MLRNPCMVIEFVLMALLNLTIHEQGSAGQSAQTDPLIAVLSEELNREFTLFKKQAIPPYYISYSVKEESGLELRSSFGVLLGSEEKHRRTLSVSVRVGDYAMDSSHKLRGEYSFTGDLSISTELPVSEENQVLAGIIWWRTNEAYRLALERYLKMKSNVAVKVTEEDKSPDFSVEKSQTSYDEPRLPAQDYDDLRRHWTKRVCAFSRPFLKSRFVYGGEAGLTITMGRTTFVSTEGARIAWNSRGAQLKLTAFSKAADGMELPCNRNYYAFTADKLPDEATVEYEVASIIDLLERMRKAPLAEPFIGPALLSGRAAGVFFHEVLGHRLEGHRQKSEDEGQTFKKKIGQQILPEDFGISADPSRSNYDEKALAGHYLFDDEGVPAFPVVVVERGVLKSFLMSRSPIEGFLKSNGHGRAQVGYRPVSRQSSLIVESLRPKKQAELREDFVQACRRSGNHYCLRFDDVEGGFTSTGRYEANSINLLPTEVYRVYTDGRPDELVRGVDLIGTPLALIAAIRSAGGDNGVFNGHCGAESGWVPVSLVAPSVLLERVEVQKKAKSPERPPLLPRPDIADEEKPLL